MKKYITIFTALLLCSCSDTGTHVEHANGVSWAGAMKNVMRKGQFTGSIALDTVNKEHLYGIGPTEWLVSEIMVMDGKTYISTVVSDSSMSVEVKDAKAPFFVFAHIDKWKEMPLPDSVHTIRQLEGFLDSIADEATVPFFFRISGAVDSATVHIVNLGEGAAARSPEEIRKNQKQYDVYNQNAEMLGVYSTRHAGVFIHHNAHTHIHFINAGKTIMGHLDKLLLKSGAVIYLQEK